MNATYFNHLSLHHLLSLIIHREENCQISIHSIYSATPSSGPWPPLADASILLRHLLVTLSDLTTQFSAACRYFLLLTVSYKYFLHNRVIRLNLRSPGIGRPLVTLLTTILVSNEDLLFRRWFFFIDPSRRRSVALHSTASPSVGK